MRRAYLDVHKIVNGLFWLVVSMPSKKDSKSSMKLKLVVIFIVVILTATYGFSLISILLNKPSLPSAASFAAEEWMDLVPEDVTYSRYLNYSDFEDLTTLLTDTVALSLWDIDYNLSIFDVNYELYMTINDTDVLALDINSSVADYIEIAYYFSDQLALPINGVPVFLINASRSTGVAWLAVYNDTIIYSEGNATAWLAISKVISAVDTPLFDNDDYKIGYLVASNQKDYFAMYYFKDADSSHQIDWAMIGLTNTMSPVQRQVFHFPTSAIATSEYNDVAATYFGNSTSISIVSNYIFGNV